MENKSNDATPQRPEGDRLLNAPLVHMDLNAFMLQIKQEPGWADSDHTAITIFKSNSMRLVLIGMHEAAELKTHTANGVISVQVLDGAIRFTAGTETVSLQKGEMIALHERLPHSVLALNESFFLLTLAMNKQE